MNTKGTIYAHPRWAGMSPGIVTAMDGNGFPIYREPRRPMKGSGIVSSLGRAAKRSARKLTRSRVVRSKLGGLKRKIGAKLKGKIGAQLKGTIGAQMKKKVSAAVKRRVNQIRPSPAVKRNSKDELSKEIRKLTPKSSIKGGPSHNELVRRAECMIYSGANF